MNKSINDPKNYARMSKPYESRVDGQTAMDAFLADVAKARQKHRIAEVIVNCAVYAPTEEQTDPSKIHIYTTGRSLGNPICWPQLIAHVVRAAMLEHSGLLQRVAELEAKTEEG